MKPVLCMILCLSLLLAACGNAEKTETAGSVQTVAPTTETLQTDGSADGPANPPETVAEVTESVQQTTAATQAVTEATSPAEASTVPTTAPTVPVTQPAEPSTQPTEPTAQPTEAPTEPAGHSALYISGVSVEDVITWFNEVVLDAEFVNSGDATLLQKWVSPIYYRIEGEPTEQDRQVLDNFCGQLNSIYGFPGIRETTQVYEASMDLFFCPQSDFTAHMGPSYEGLDGAVTFWYNGANQIYDATICYRTDLDQYVRNSVILEEIYNGLGPVQDTWLRSDSIIYAGYSTPQYLTSVDWLLLKLLYHPDMKCGMTASQCEEVIRSLYY